jgi:hypothetical protein
VSRDASGNFAANVITATLTGQATSALTAATVTAGVQTAISQVGTLTSLAVSGNVTAGNVTAGNVTATTGTIIAATGQFTNINNSLTLANTAINSLATGANANVAAYLTTATGNISAGNVTVTGLVTAKNFNGQARNAGTLGAAGTLTIDFATDHNVLVTLTTTATIAFSNITAGKIVTVLVKNATGNNRAVTLGVAAGNTTGGSANPNVNDGRTGVLVYRTFGTATTDVYCEFN